MKRIKIIESFIKESHSNQLTINNVLAQVLKDEILKQALMEVSEEPIKFYRGIDGKTCWMVGGGVQVMTTGCYQFLMKYYFNIEAFTKEEIKDLDIELWDSNKEHDLYYLAHDILTGRGKDFIPLLRRLLKGIITEEISNGDIIISVANAINSAALDTNH